jgi:hypothetical protein
MSDDEREPFADSGDSGEAAEDPETSAPAAESAAPVPKATDVAPASLEPAPFPEAADRAEAPPRDRDDRGARGGREGSGGRGGKGGGPGGPRPVLSEEREPLFREEGGFRLRLEPPDLVRLRELPGAKGKSDRELGEEFFEKQAERLAQSLAEDVTPPAEVRVVVDPYSRQAFLAIERTIRSILSF